MQVTIEARQRMRWLDEVTEAVALSLNGLHKIIKDSKGWRNVVYGVGHNFPTNNRIEHICQSMYCYTIKVLRTLKTFYQYCICLYCCNLIFCVIFENIKGFPKHIIWLI